MVQQALNSGRLTSSMETTVGELVAKTEELSTEEYQALEQLMGAIRAGAVVAQPYKHFINVMEELVLSEALKRVAEIDVTSDDRLDVGDITAYALNRLPPLYATTEEGAAYQRHKAQAELQHRINQYIGEGIERSLERPEMSPGRQMLKPTGNNSEVGTQVSSLLQTLAPSLEESEGGADGPES